jgi:hypothetical protein
MTRAGRAAVLILLLGSATSLSCGGENAGAASEADETASAAAEPSGQKIEPCQMLTDDQVATVVAGATGMTVSSGGSLLAEMDDYQCTWVNTDTHSLILIVHQAHSDSSFALVRPDPARFAEARTVSVGDGGWFRTNPQGNPEVTATKGRSLIILELDSPDKTARTEALIELARAVAARL